MQSAKRFACTLCRRRKMKCDGARPSCMTCTRLQYQCEYVEPQRRVANKRRNMKDLEARLKEVEGLLASHKGSTTSSNYIPPLSPKQDQMSMVDIDMQRLFDGIDETSNGNLPNNADVDIWSGDTNPPSPILFQPVKEVVPLGLEESLPPQDVIDELHEIYFNRIHTAIPIFHKSRYLSAMKLPSHMAPAICLRYAAWTLAASVSERHGQYEATFYERARKYAQADEMKDIGQSLATLDHTRFWILISDYESRKMFFHRSWSSGGRAVRLAQMSGLHRLDDLDGNFTRNLSPDSCIDLEERRRVFWAAFCGDRYSCTVTGWPLAIDEKDIVTNLPASEEAYEKGEESIGISLSAALDNDVIPNVSSYAGIVIMAALFGRIVVHLHRPNPHNGFQDVAHGDFWRRHRKMDGVLSNMVMVLPSHLRLTSDVKDCHLFFLNLNMHTLIVALHQAAMTKVEMYGLDPSLIRHSQARSNAAAEEIVRMMRLAPNANIENMHPFVTFSLHMTVSSFVRTSEDSMHEYQSRRNLEILLAVLRALKRKLPTLQYVIEQIKYGLETVGRDKARPISQRYAKSHVGLPTSASSAIYSPESQCDGSPGENLDLSAQTKDSVSSTSGNDSLSNVGLATRPFFLRGKSGMSHVSNSPTESSTTTHDTIRSRAEPIISGSNPGITRNQDSEGFNFMQFENGQQRHQEQRSQPQHSGQNDILYTVPQRNINDNYPSRRPDGAPDDANFQANLDAVNGSSYFPNFSLGDTLPSNAFEELLTWEGIGMTPP